MATSRSQLYKWFSRLLKPTQGQFAAAWDSFWHKDEDAIPIASIDNLSTTLAEKAEKAELAKYWNDRGNYDASTNEYPTGKGSGVGGNINQGDVYLINVDGVLGGSSVSVGDLVRALQYLPGQNPTNWHIISRCSAMAATWGSIGGDIGNQTDLVTLLNLYADANLIFELNTTLATGCLIGYSQFVSALIGDNPDMVINSFIQDGRFIKINCKGLLYLSDSLFAGSTEIVSVKDISGIKEIFQNCFNGSTLVSCSLLFVEKVYESAFKDCNNLLDIYLPKLKIINDSYAFSNTGIRYLCFPSLLSVGAFAFEGCNNLESVSLPSAIILGTSVFQNCSDLESVCLPSAYRVAGLCFVDCSSLSKMFLPSVVNMGDRVFENCNNLTELIVLSRFGAVLDIEGANSISAKILGNKELPYKKYVALINQFSTNAPTAIVLENELTALPTFIRRSAGQYSIYFPVVATKRWVSITNNVSINTQVQFDIDNQMDEYIFITITDLTSGNNGDGFMSLTPIEIRVYN